VSGFVDPSPGVVLASRENAGIRVTLLWAAATDAVAVRVLDDGNDDEFELRVEPGVNPLDVYEHPYAYAAWRGIDFRSCTLPAGFTDTFTNRHIDTGKEAS
jgi:hypothetical protein